MPTAFVRGVTISWSEVGEGPVAVFAHGLTTSRAHDVGGIDWQPIADAGNRLITFDARGHGLSSGGANPNEYEWSELAKDLVAFIREVAPGQTVTGIGISMGTATIIHAVLVAPELFGRLVLAAVQTAWETRRSQSETYRLMAELVEAKGVRALVEQMRSQPRADVLSEMPQWETGPDIREEVLPSVFLGAGMSDLPDETLIETIEVPTLILAWAGDPRHPVASAAQLHDLIAGSQFDIAETPAQLRQWGSMAAEFIARQP